MNTQAVPTRPWEKEKSVRRRSTATLLLGALIAYVVVLFTGFAGPDGWAVVLFTLAAVFTFIKNRKLQAKERKNAKAHLIILAAAIVAFTPWISIFVSVVF
jgi:hypothetical protein